MLTDLHCHILPAVDDGPTTLDGSLALAQELVRDGVERVVATPHVSATYPTAAGTVHDRVDVLRAALAERGVPLVVEPGAEVSALRVPDLDADQLGELGLGGSRWLLLEAPLAEEFPIEAAARTLQDAGFGVVLAHPERCALFQRQPRRVRALIDDGAHASVTAGSLVGDFGRPARTLALALVNAGLVGNVTSDAHDAVRRPPRLLRDLRAAGLGDRTRAWCEELPGALLADRRAGLEPRARATDI